VEQVALLHLQKGGIGSDQRLDLVGGENSTERRLRVGRVSAKGPTSRKEREKWGTRHLLKNATERDTHCVGNARKIKSLATYSNVTLQDFHILSVTSDLASPLESAHHHQGGGGLLHSESSGSKYFVSQIFEI
jgi:hypothetical protein